VVIRDSILWACGACWVARSLRILFSDGAIVMRVVRCAISGAAYGGAAYLTVPDGGIFLPLAFAEIIESSYLVAITRVLLVEMCVFTCVAWS